MLRTVAFFAYLFPLMSLTTFLLPVVALVGLLGGDNARDRFLRITISAWARHLLWFGGVPVTVEERGRPPRTGPLCVVANHQGNADILLAVGFVPRLVGFIAKRELRTMPVIRSWMRAIHCVFLERSSARRALRALGEASRRMSAGRAMILFPEGTRSRGPRMSVFRAGSMKVIKDAAAPVLPVTIDGTFRLFEEEGRIRTVPVRLVFHPIVPAETVTRLGRRELADHLQRIIGEPLDASRARP
mgnify:CR=1 FL=1